MQFAYRFDVIWAIFYLCFALNFDNQPKSKKGLLLLFLKMEKVFIIMKAQNYKLFLYKNISILQLCPLYNARNERHFKVFLCNKKYILYRESYYNIYLCIYNIHYRQTMQNKIYVVEPILS